MFILLVFITLYKLNSMCKKSLKMLEFSFKNSYPLKVIENSLSFKYIKLKIALANNSSFKRWMYITDCAVSSVNFCLALDSE